LDGIINPKQKLVVEGGIIDNCEEQVIKISYTSSTERAKFIGVANCEVQVVDQNNTIFTFEEDLRNTGYYRGVIPEGNLLTGSKFRLHVKTPDGKSYKSNYEEMLPCPPIDTVYYYIEHKETETPGKKVDGVQFYIDLEGSGYFGRYYRWIVEETYEFHSSFPKKDYLDEAGEYHSEHIDFSTFICYKTEVNNELFLLTTEGLKMNKYKKAYLHFVDDHTQRLLFNYSILVKQHSLSKEAYSYWLTIKKNNQETDGLFAEQPSMPIGNIRNENDSTEVVLGYFSVSSETTKRIVIKYGVYELRFDEVPWCTPIVSEGPLPLEPRPMYFINTTKPDGTSVIGYTFPQCVDCTLLDGVLEKPDFFN
jgi:hypothetical protein